MTHGESNGESDSSDDSEENDAEPELVDTPSRCQILCDELLKENMLAVDIEGVSLGRHGEICIVQVSDPQKRVFLFDITGLGSAAFETGLKKLLESASVTKLLYDCRGDADALYHLHGIRLSNVLDMQVLCAKATGRGSKFLPGMVKALGHVLPYAQKQVSKGIKLAGAALFAPDQGGSYEVWRRRPLPVVLRTYCAQDVVHLFAMWERWKECLPLDTLRTISEERIRTRIEAVSVETGSQNALLDFAFPADHAEEDEPASKRQRQNS